MTWETIPTPRVKGFVFILVLFVSGCLFATAEEVTTPQGESIPAANLLFSDASDLFYSKNPLTRKKNQNTASSMFTRLIDIYPASDKVPNANLMLGHYAHQQERFDQAIDYYLKSLVSEDNYGYAMFYLAESYLKTGQEKEAKEWFERVTREDPDFKRRRKANEYLVNL